MLVKIWTAVVCIMTFCILVGEYRHVSEEHNVSIFTVNIVVAVCLVIPGLNIGIHPKMKKYKPNSLGSDTGLYSLERKVNCVLHTRTHFPQFEITLWFH